LFLCNFRVKPNPLKKGRLSFVLTWSHKGDRQRNGPDIDIWVKDPRGNNLSSARSSQMGPTAEGGQVDLDDEGGYAEKGDDGSGSGPERVFWPVGIPSGEYLFGCRYAEGNGTALCRIQVFIGNNKPLVFQDRVGPDKKESRTWKVRINR